MTADAGAERHLSAQGFGDYLAADVPVVLPIPGEPRVVIFVDPGRRRIGLRSPIEADVSSLPSPLENLHFSIVVVDGIRQLEIVSSEPELFPDIYPMLCAIADRIQLHQATSLAALEETLDVWGRVLARRGRLSHEQEIGLFGELTVLQALTSTWNSPDAVSSWRGPLAEEHDFGLPGFDVEIKTTAGERRRHWFDLTQLVPSPSRSLWVVSLQITRAAVDDGRTLPELIERVRSLVSDEAARARLDAVLRSLYWHDDQQDLYVQRWARRSPPRALRVDASFPTLTPASLATLHLHAGEVTQVRYELDLTDRTSHSPPQLLAAALEAAA